MLFLHQKYEKDENDISGQKGQQEFHIEEDHSPPVHREWRI